MLRLLLVGGHLAADRLDHGVATSTRNTARRTSFRRVGKELPGSREAMKALRIFSSSIKSYGPKASSMGAVGKPFLSSRYPMMPETNMTITPYMELEVE